jgi:outer membrane immunogenic protein
VRRLFGAQLTTSSRNRRDVRHDRICSMSSLKFALLGAVAILLPAGVQAADLPAEIAAPIMAPEPVAGWAGFYAGSLVGYGWSNFETSHGGGSTDGDVDGSTGGGLIGYNWQNGKFVYGIEGDITLHVLRGDIDGTADVAAVEADSMYSARVRARLGYDLGWAMPFVAAGGVMNESYIHASADRFDGDVQRLYGWTAGAGVDFKVNLPFIENFLGPLVLRAEYVYEDFGDEDFSVAGGLNAEQGTHFVRGAVIWRPGDAPAASTAVSGDVVDWSGHYGGLAVGYGHTNLETSSDLGTEDFDADGALGGLYLGHNFQFGKWVVGYEGSLMLANLEGDGAQPGAGNVDMRTNIEADTRLRVGYAMGNFLPFVAAGASWTRSEQETADGQERGRIPAELWNVGAGVDYRVSDHVSLRGEYIYAQSWDSQTANFNGVATDQDLELHEVRIGAAYHFN